MLIVGLVAVVAIGVVFVFKVPGALNGGLVNQVGGINYPAIGSGAQAPSSGGDNFSWSIQTTGFTEVTDDLYYSGGYLGTLKIPAIGLSVKVYQSTGSKTLARVQVTSLTPASGMESVCVAAHNRGVNADFGKLHTLEPGDTVTLTTKLGTRTYAVTSDNRLTIYIYVSGMNRISAGK